MEIAQRVHKLPTYVFATIGQRIQTLCDQGVDVIRVDIGSPDLAPPEKVIETLINAARRPSAHGYPNFYGEPIFRDAVADYYERHFGVKLNPKTEILALIGSKEGISHVPTAFVDPGTVVLAPDPGYPTYRNPTIFVEGVLYLMPLLRENNFFPDFDAIPDEAVEKARVLWLNYPNNPTAAVADIESLERAVAFARRHSLLLAYDNPYCDLSWNGVNPPSILQVEGAMDVAVEFNSLSKMVNMAGWRVGMAVGNPTAIEALGRVKTNIDTGIFRPIQEAATVALKMPPEWFDERNAIYRRRRAIVTRTLERMRLWYTPYAATLYVWSEIPQGYTSAEFAQKLLEDTGVSVAPGTAFGPHGEGYVRVSLVQPEDRLEEAMERWERWLISKALQVSVNNAS